ncbi:MAG: ABC transporter ATP-binding protein [Hyphomicrobium sp.]|nr:ABC transporter ATP-binding protein [Hyphomicrobium sp.]PPD07612.1 MAG: ABC transporter [Hyphomicrobium sp.]
MKKQKPPTDLWPVMKRVLREDGSRYWPKYVLASLFLAISGGCTALAAWIMKDVIDDIFVARDQTAMMLIPLAIAGLFLLRGITIYAGEVMLNRVGNKIVAETQVKLYSHLLKQDIAFFKTHPSGDLLNRMTVNATALRTMLNQIALSLGRDVMTLLALLCVMLAQDLTLSLIVFAVGPLAFLSLRLLTQRIQGLARRGFTKGAEILTTVRDSVQGVQTVKSYQLEAIFNQRLQSEVDAMRRNSNRMGAIQATIAPLIEIFAGAAVAAVIFYAGWRLNAADNPPGSFFAFVTALLMAAEPGRRLARVQGQLIASATGVRMIHEIIDLPEAEGADGDRPPLAISSGEIAFKNVSFSYLDDIGILSGITFTAPGGKTTALVGLSGSGKSTTLALLERFWSPNAGTIEIDGQNIADVTLESLRRNIAFVSQDTFLFQGTIKENLVAGTQDRTMEDIVAAARSAQIHDFIAGLPEGYDTPVGEMGSRLSGGQRQRISIARAFLKDAPILLLDEPTSALDSETELALRQSLDKLSEGRTAIVIAHRLATIVGADQILVLENGRIVENGTHRDLIGRGATYARIYDLQKLH